MEAYHIDRFGSVDGIVLRSSEDPRGNLFAQFPIIDDQRQLQMRPRLLHRGNDPVGTVKQRQIGQASMRPRLLHRGNPGRRCSSARRRCRFNEAPAASPGKWAPGSGPRVSLGLIIKLRHKNPLNLAEFEEWHTRIENIRFGSA